MLVKIELTEEEGDALCLLLGMGIGQYMNFSSGSKIPHDPEQQKKHNQILNNLYHKVPAAVAEAKRP